MSDVSCEITVVAGRIAGRGKTVSSLGIGVIASHNVTKRIAGGIVNVLGGSCCSTLIAICIAAVIVNVLSDISCFFAERVVTNLIAVVVIYVSDFSLSAAFFSVAVGIANVIVNVKRFSYEVAFFKIAVGVARVVIHVSCMLPLCNEDHIALNLH